MDFENNIKNVIDRIDLKKKEEDEKKKAEEEEKKAILDGILKKIEEEPDPDKKEVLLKEYKEVERFFRTKRRKKNKIRCEEIDEDSDEETAEYTYTKPLTTTDYEVPEFKVEMYSNHPGAKAKWLVKMSKLLTFIKGTQYRRSSKEGVCTILEIFTRGKRNLDLWGSHEIVSRNIQLMKDMGIISLYSDYVMFNSTYSMGYEYKYYRENEKKFIEFCKDNSIEPYILKNNNYEKVSKVKMIPDFNNKRVEFSTNLRLEKPSGVSENKFKDILELCLYNRYPCLKYYQDIADYVNEKYYKDYDELKIRFRPTFKWSEGRKSITKIGIRASNKIVGESKEDRKKYILPNYGLDREKDIKSSVPRLTLSLNLGHWVDESVDIYEKIYREFEPNKEFNTDIRENIKDIHMRMYFDDSENDAANHTLRKMNQDNLEKNETTSFIKELHKAIVRAEGGKVYGSYIFYVESCVYLDVLKRILDEGYFTWMLFDCFYTRGQDWEDQEMFEIKIKELVEASFYDFLERSKKNGDITLKYKAFDNDEVVNDFESKILSYDLEDDKNMEKFKGLCRFLESLKWIEDLKPGMIKGDRIDKESFENGLISLEFSLSTLKKLNDYKEIIINNLRYLCKEEVYRLLSDLIELSNEIKDEDILFKKIEELIK